MINIFSFLKKSGKIKESLHFIIKEILAKLSGPNKALFFALFISQFNFSQQQIITTQKKEKIKAYIKHFEENNQLMGTVAIMENGKEQVNETFGSINKKANGLLSKRKYTMGSITKLFTGVLFAKLFEKGKISYTEKLSSYFPNIPNADKIKMSHMLSHKSGLKDYISKGDSIPFWLNKPQSKNEIINEITKKGIAFQPGESLAYSNAAYYLLGSILEKKYQKPYGQILKDEITDPLNLANTIALDENASYKDIAKSYERKSMSTKWTEMEEFYFPNTFSSGFIASTASDMNIFLDALFNYKIIKKETLQSIIPGEKDWFGMGIMKAPYAQFKGYGHGGDTYGTHSLSIYENNLAITYIINGEYYPNYDFSIGLLSVIYDKEFVFPSFETYTPDKRFFGGYIGNYISDKLPYKIKIYVEKGSLKAKIENQEAFILKPIDKNIFRSKKAGIEVEFYLYDENKMTLKKAGQKFEMTKE